MKFKGLIAAVLISGHLNAMEAETLVPATESKAELIMPETDLTLSLLVDGFLYVKNESQAQQLVKEIKHRLKHPRSIMVQVNKKCSPAITKLLGCLLKKIKAAYKPHCLTAARAFIEHGKQINEYDYEGWTPLYMLQQLLIYNDYSEDEKELFSLFDLLLQQGAAVNGKTENSSGFAFNRECNERILLIDTIRNLILLLDDYAIAKKNAYTIMDKLLQAGADINIQETDTGDTPLHVAVKGFNFCSGRSNKNLFAATKYLLEKGAIINKVNEKKKQPFACFMSTFKKTTNEGNIGPLNDVSTLINLFMHYDVKANRTISDALTDLLDQLNFLQVMVRLKSYPNEQLGEINHATSLLKVINLFLTYKIKIASADVNFMGMWVNRLEHFGELETHNKWKEKLYKNDEDKKLVETTLAQVKLDSATLYKKMKMLFEVQKFSIPIAAEDIIGADVITQCNNIHIKKNNIYLTPVLTARIANNNQFKNFIVYATKK